MDVRPELRIADTDREAMVRRLAGAYAEGRIDDAELEDRLEAVACATTGSELERVAADLPRPVPARASAPLRSSARLAPPGRLLRPGRLLDLQVMLVTPVVLAALFVAINTGTYVWPAWMWVLATAPIIAWLVGPLLRAR